MTELCWIHYTLMLWITCLDHTWVFVVAFFPGAFFPVHVRGKLRRSWNSTLTFLPSLSLLPSGALGSRLSLISFLSFCASWSLKSNLSRAALVSFDSVTSITARCPRGTRHAMHAGDAICPWLSTVTHWDLCQRKDQHLKFCEGASYNKMTGSVLM